jgi:hypothetical protein
MPANTYDRMARLEKERIGLLGSFVRNLGRQSVRVDGTNYLTNDGNKSLRQSSQNDVNAYVKKLKKLAAKGKQY